MPTNIDPELRQWISKYYADTDVIYTILSQEIEGMGTSISGIKDTLIQQFGSQVEPILNITTNNMADYADRVASIILVDKQYSYIVKQLIGDYHTHMSTQDFVMNTPKNYTLIYIIILIVLLIVGIILYFIFRKY